MTLSLAERRPTSCPTVTSFPISSVGHEIISLALSFPFPPLPPSPSFVFGVGPAGVVGFVGDSLFDFNNSGVNWAIFPCFHFSCSCDCPSMVAQIVNPHAQMDERTYSPSFIGRLIWLTQRHLGNTRNRFPRLNSFQKVYREG